MGCNPFTDQCGEMEIPAGSCRTGADLASAVVAFSLEVLEPFYSCGSGTIGDGTIGSGTIGGPLTCDSIVGYVSHGEPTIPPETDVNVVAAWLSNTMAVSPFNDQTGSDTSGLFIPRTTITAGLYLGPLWVGELAQGQWIQPTEAQFLKQSQLAAAIAETWWTRLYAEFSGHGVSIAGLTPKGFTGSMAVWATALAVI